MGEESIKCSVSFIERERMMEQERDMNLPLSQSAPVHPSGHVHVKDPLLLEQFPPLWHRFCKHSLTSGSLQQKKKFKKILYSNITNISLYM